MKGCLDLDYASFELIVVSDMRVELPDEARLVLSGSGRDTGPGEKRDLGMLAGQGDFFAFIDDDAVPRSDWLTQAVKPFKDDSVGAVAGPGVTPPASPWAQRVSGAFYESWLGSGPFV